MDNKWVNAFYTKVPNYFNGFSYSNAFAAEHLNQLKFAEAFDMIGANPSLIFFTAHFTKELVQLTISISTVLAVITKINRVTICCFFLLTKNNSWRPPPCKEEGGRGVFHDKHEIILLMQYETFFRNFIC